MFQRLWSRTGRKSSRGGALKFEFSISLPPRLKEKISWRMSCSQGNLMYASLLLKASDSAWLKCSNSNGNTSLLMKRTRLRTKRVRYRSVWDNSIHGIDFYWQVRHCRTTYMSCGVCWISSYQRSSLRRMLSTRCSTFKVIKTKLRLRRKRGTSKSLSSCTEFLDHSCWEESRKKLKRHYRQK